jgi:S1-C subfamily serine protease
MGRPRNARRWTAGAALACIALLPAAAVCASPARAKAMQKSPVHGSPQSYLGIDFRDVSDDQVTQLKLKGTRGVEVIRVDHDAPAGKMGLRAHDVILQMNGIAIEGEEQLRRMLHDTPPGKLVALTIGRDGATLSVSAPMADRAQLERQAWEQHLNVANPAPAADATDTDSSVSGQMAPAPVPVARANRSFLGTLLTSPTYTGLMVEGLSPQLAQFFGVPVNGGLLVRSVADNSPAALAGVRAGDVLVKANAQAVGSLSHWTKTVREAKGRPIGVMVMRDRQVKTLTLVPEVKHK